MPSWNVVHRKGREYELLNGSGTPIRLSPKAQPDISWLMARMEELGIPIAYTMNLEEIYFTFLKGRDHGDYRVGKIRISSNKETKEIMDSVFVHELAHFVDDMDDVTSNDLLIKEKKQRAKYMPDPYAKKNVGEYLAVGFEVYYLGTDEEKKRMRKSNPRLYRTIASLHHRFSRK